MTETEFTMVIEYLKRKLFSTSAGQWGDVLWLFLTDIDSSQRGDTFR